MKHGGDTITYQHLYNGNMIDFSSNINPLGPPERLKKAILEGLNVIHVYPDIRYRALKTEVAQYLGCDKDEVLLGNGAVEIIHTLCMMFEKVVVPVPSFIEYTERPKILGKKVVTVKLNGDFELDQQALLDSVTEGSLLILGNPNNPTGKRIKKETLSNIHRRVKEKNAFLLLDEVFWEFCSEDYDSISLFYGSSHVCIIRAATKFFALPGIRLGYAYAPKEMAKRYDSLTLPWSINTFADIAGRLIFKQNEYIKQSKAYMATQRRNMLAKLNKFPRMKVFPTDCNYILIRLLEDTEEQLFAFMIRKGILIRKASSFEGLDKTYIRVAVKDEESNQYFIKCLNDYFYGGQYESNHDYRTKQRER